VRVAAQISRVGKRLVPQMLLKAHNKSLTNSRVSDKALEIANFSATWDFPIGLEDEPVHVTPNADVSRLTPSNPSAFTLEVF